MEVEHLILQASFQMSLLSTRRGVHFIYAHYTGPVLEIQVKSNSSSQSSFTIFTFGDICLKTSIVFNGSKSSTDVNFSVILICIRVVNPLDFEIMGTVYK